MAAIPATPNFVHEEVDFMTMFTAQNDDTTSSFDVKPQLQQQQAPVAPLQRHHHFAMAQPTLPAVDPLHVFDMPVTQQHQGWSTVAVPMHQGFIQQQPQQHMAYAQPTEMYPTQLGQPFVHTMSAAPVPQYIEPSVALPNGGRPSSAPTPMAAPVMAGFAPAPGSANTPAAPATTTVTPAATAAASPATDAAPTAASTTAASDAAGPTSGTTASPAGSCGASDASPPSGRNSPVSGSGGGETRTVRRKRKLTPEDKRRICEIYRNSQGKIRQEDIAKEYSVDRSTISKILNQEERWLEGDAGNANSSLARRPGGRYPAIEEEMHRWLDDAVLHGREVRDAEAREEALKIGLRLGHPSFQASSKWWDGVKRRRIEEGRAMPVTRRPNTAPLVMPGLVRSYSAMAIDTGMPREVFPMGPTYHLVDGNVVPVMPMAMHHVPMAARARSQSSPQVPMGYAQQPASFGPQRHSPTRHSPVTPLSRNRTYHGQSGSPQRPSPLNRANSASGRPSPHQRLGASAFGLTPVKAEPIQHVAVGPELATVSPDTPFSSQVPGPNMSPMSVTAVSDSSEHTAATGPSPSTPRTPVQASFVPHQVEPIDLNAAPYTLDGQVMVPIYNPMHTPTPQHGCQPIMQYAVPPPVYPGYEYVQQW